MNPRIRKDVWYSIFAAEYVRIISMGSGPRRPDTYDAVSRAAALADTGQYELEKHDEALDGLDYGDDENGGEK